MEKLAEELRTTLKCFISLTYNCTDEQQASMRETHSELTRLMNKFKASLPHEEGLLVRPVVRKNLKQSRQKKCAATIASQLPTKTKRGRKKADAAYRNRVEKKAQVLRRVRIFDRKQ